MKAAAPGRSLESARGPVARRLPVCDDPAVPDICFSDPLDVAAEIRRLFRDLDQLHGPCAAPAEWTPELDVVETPDQYEVRLDVPGVPASALRVLIKHGTLLVAGEKAPFDSARDGTAYHVVERGFGRFARAVRLPVGIDAGRVKATVADGELVIAVPKLDDRRGQELIIPVAEG
jgi:HSP20 family protein